MARCLSCECIIEKALLETSMEQMTKCVHLCTVVSYRETGSEETDLHQRNHDLTESDQCNHNWTEEHRSQQNTDETTNEVSVNLKPSEMTVTPFLIPWQPLISLTLQNTGPLSFLHILQQCRNLPEGVLHAQLYRTCLIQMALLNSRIE